jgi:hypothetical protein
MRIGTKGVASVRYDTGAPTEAQVRAIVGASTICPLFALGPSGRAEPESLYDE